MSTLFRFLEEQDILLDVHAQDKQHLFETIGAHLHRVHGVAAESVARALERRESVGTTALGHGVAIPHARIPELDEIRIIYVRLTPGLAYDTPDGEPVSDVMALMVPAPSTQAHLDLLAQVASLFNEKDFRTALRRCQHPAQVRRTIELWQERVAARPAILKR